jgi:CO dehydrogenase maturation factor
MKLAISGKGGVGKTLLTALLARALAAKAFEVIAIDADPDANLGLALGFPEAAGITPVAEMKELIAERTGAGAGPYFKINPQVADIPDKFSAVHDHIRLLVMGRPKAGGAGCYCPENSVLAALTAHLLLARDEVVLLDMAAGIEHLNRGTAKAVDRLIIVVEPGLASIETARRIAKLASDIGLTRVSVVANKIHTADESDYLAKALPEFAILGFIPYDQALVAAELRGESKLSASPGVTAAVDEILARLMAG